MKTNEAVLRTLIDGGIRRGFTLPGLGITWSLRAFHERRDEYRKKLNRPDALGGRRRRLRDASLR